MLGESLTLSREESRKQKNRDRRRRGQSFYIQIVSRSNYRLRSALIFLL